MKFKEHFTFIILIILMTASISLNLHFSLNQKPWSPSEKLNYKLVHGSENAFQIFLNNDEWIDAHPQLQQVLFNNTIQYLNNLIYSQKNNNISLSQSIESLQKINFILKFVSQWQNLKTLSFLASVIMNPQYPNNIKTTAFHSFTAIQKKLNNVEFEAFKYSSLTPEVSGFTGSLKDF